MESHFSEMEGDVGMSPHEKKEKQEDAYIHRDRKLLKPHPYIFVSFIYI